jgi:hypothetical protein
MSGLTFNLYILTQLRQKVGILPPNRKRHARQLSVLRDERLRDELPENRKDGAPEIHRKAWATRVFGAEGSNRSGSFTWAGKQEKLRSMQLCFFLTAPFIELIRNWPFGCAITTDLQNKGLNEVFDPATQRTLANFQPVPELRHRGEEFKRNITARRLRRNGHDDALLRLIVCLVRYHYSLAGLDTTRHQDQSASSIDGDCKGLLVKRIAT